MSSAGKEGRLSRPSFGFHRLKGRVDRLLHHSSKVDEHDSESPSISVQSKNTDRVDTGSSDRPQDSSSAKVECTVTSEAPDVVTTKHASIHKALWETAYQNLKRDESKAKYLNRYEELISLSLSDQEKTGPLLGEERMKRIIDQGLEKIEKSKLARGLSERNIAVVTAVKGLLDIPLQKIPQVALPWAVISSSVDILLNPVRSGIDLCNGVGYVVGRIEWFSQITDKILSQNSTGDEEPFRPIHESIQTSIIDLYQSLLFYQIQAVCVYNEKHPLFFLLTRGVFEFDDWSGSLEAIKSAEERLHRDCELYDLELLKSEVREIRIGSKAQEEIAIFKRRLELIRRVDPAKVGRNIQERKEEAIDDLYTWIFDTDLFKQFSEWGNEARQLWVSGQAGTGKTMFVIGAVKQIQAGRLLTAGGEAPCVIYFFCQSEEELNNGTAVLRGLVWMLLYQKPDLSKHLDSQFLSGEKWVEDQNAFSTWGGILLNMINDCDSLVIIIDAIDECEVVSRKILRDFLDKLLQKGLLHVKLLLTSRPLHELPGSLPDNVAKGHSLLHMYT